MKILDEKSRLFGIINPVDLLLILVVIAVLFVLASTLFPNASPTKAVPNDVVRAEMLVGNVRGFVPSSIKIGDPMNRKTGGKLGKVVAVKAVPGTFEEATADGVLKLSTSKLFQDVYITVEGPGQINEGVSAFMGDEQLRSNQTIDIQTPTFEAARARVLRISKAQ